MTTDGAADTTVVTATVVGAGPAGNTTVCFWAVAVSMEEETSLDRAALLEKELTFCVVVLALWMVGLVKVIFTGDRCGGSELAMLCMMLLILGLLTGTVMLLETGGVALETSFSITGDELDEFVRRRLRGFSSSSEQLTPGRAEESHDGSVWSEESHDGSVWSEESHDGSTVLPLGSTTTLEDGLGGRGDFTAAPRAPLGAVTPVEEPVVLV
ncbi:hypothetical protein EYF80_042131 [Liparis tanakae]|uniref:Uncharacterized protein n=1 Tax=Liparis tanakae TaxID=230148 RepID=A0A4Z2G297_9TELE|nr:hypothetical protein EYF80_042131 [Liparis tanakae]